MRKILLSFLLCTFAVATWAQTQTTAVKLSFTRNGQNVDVAVTDQDGNAISGASATVAFTATTTDGSTNSWKANGTLGTKTNVICPDANANKNANINMVFEIVGLKKYSVKGVDLDIHAFNGEGNYQDPADNKTRQWNVVVAQGETTVANFANIEISQGNEAGRTMNNNHKVHTVEVADAPVTTDPMSLNFTITTGTVNGGCFFGLSEIILDVEEIPTTYQFKGANLTSSQLNAATEPMYIAIKNLSNTNNYWFVGNTGDMPYSKAAYEEAAIFVWEPVIGVVGSHYLKKLDGTYMQTTSPKDFGTVDNAAVFTTTNPTSQGSGSTNFNGDSSSANYIDGNDDSNLVRFVKGDNWINVQNGDSGTPVYNDGKGGWTIHYVYKLEQVEGFKANISAAKYSTMYTTYSVDLSQAEGVSAYYIKNDGFENEGYVTLTQVESNVIPAYTPVILYAESAGEYTLPYTTEEGVALAGNLLQGTFVNTNVVGDAYVLSNPASGVGLYKVDLNKKDGTAFLNNGGKAYLPAINVSANFAVQGFKFGDFTSTAIEGVVTGNEDAKVIYDLSGRRLNNITNAGVYIINGKKVMVK